MYALSNITDDYAQTQNIVLPDGTQILMTVYFIQQQYGWFITSLAYEAFLLQGYRITNSPNMLHQYRNLIPFGLACYSANDREPSQLQDFSSGASQLFVLTPAEVQAYTDFLNGN
jgi:hypothetical protein